MSATQPIKRWLSALTITAITAFTSSTYAGEQNPNVAAPEIAIQQATANIINQLQATEVEARDFVLVKKLVVDNILPIIDQTKVAKMALGKHWKKANKDQRTSFISTFRDLQIKTYTGAFRAFNGQSYEFKPTRYNDKKNRAIVIANLLQPGGKPVPIAFKLHLSKGAQSWKIYDATVAGIGLVKTYRDQLSQQLRSSSLDQIIESMQQQLVASNAQNPS